MAAVTVAMANLAKALLGALWPLVALVVELSYCLHKPLDISNVKIQLRRSCNWQVYVDTTAGYISRRHANDDSFSSN